MIFPWVKHANKKYKYKNTQIQHMTTYQKDPTCCVFLKKKKVCLRISKMTFPWFKHANTKYTSTQIQHMAKWQKDPTCGIFLKRGLFKNIKNHIPMSQIGKYKNTNLRYTNAAPKCQKDPTCGIFLKRGLFKDIFWVLHSCTRSSFHWMSFLDTHNGFWTDFVKGMKKEFLMQFFSRQGFQMVEFQKYFSVPDKVHA